MNEQEMKARIARLEMELEEERKKYDIVREYTNCALWEYEIASKRLVLSRKLDGKYSKTNMEIEDYQKTMHGWNLVHPDDWGIFDAYCESMDRGEEHFQYDIRQVTDESMFVWLRYVGETVFDRQHRPVKVVGKTLDVSQEKRSNEELRQMAQRDSLTGLYNKEMTKQLISQYMENFQRGEAEDGGIFFIVDVDDFKNVNDTWGHLYGDFVLKQVANILTVSSSHGDIVGRIGGDEFCLFAKMRSSREEAQEIAQRIHFKAQNTQMKEDMELKLSIGIARFPGDADVYEELYRKADLALYASKRSGKNNFHFYEKNAVYPEPDGTKRTARTDPAADAPKEEEHASGSREELLEEQSRELWYLNRMLEGNLIAYYAVEPETYRLCYAGKGIRNLFPWYSKEETCYAAIMGKQEPCPDCPLKMGKNRKKDYMVEIYKDNLGRNYEVNVQHLNGGPGGTRLITWRDISALVKKRGGLDEMTGMLHFQYFAVRLSECLLKESGEYAVVMLGLYGLEQANEKYGIAYGSEIIKNFASYIKKILKAEEFTCHLKGDDFFLLLNAREESVSERINHLAVTFEAMLEESFRQCRMKVYAGIYHVPKGECLAEDVCDKAHRIRETAKRCCMEGKNIEERWYMDELSD